MVRGLQPILLIVYAICLNISCVDVPCVTLCLCPVSHCVGVLCHTLSVSCVRYVVERKDLSVAGTEWRPVSGSPTENTKLSFPTSDFLPDRDYLYRIKATNEYGTSNPSMPVSWCGKSGTRAHCRITNKTEHIMNVYRELLNMHNTLCMCIGELLNIHRTL